MTETTERCRACDGEGEIPVSACRRPACPCGGRVCGDEWVECPACEGTGTE